MGIWGIASQAEGTACAKTFRRRIQTEEQQGQGWVNKGDRRRVRKSKVWQAILRTLVLTGAKLQGYLEVSKRGMAWSSLNFIGITLSWMENRQWKPRIEAGNQLQSYGNNGHKILVEEVVRSSKDWQNWLNIFDEVCERRRRAEKDSRVFGLKNWKDWVDIIIWNMQRLGSRNKAANSFNGKIIFLALYSFEMCNFNLSKGWDNIYCCLFWK